MEKEKKNIFLTNKIKLKLLPTGRKLPAALAATASWKTSVTNNMSDGLSIPTVRKISK